MWHTKTVNPEFKKFKNIEAKVHKSTNIGALNKYWCLYLGDNPCGVRWKEKGNESKKYKKYENFKKWK